jgi:hypothetical protein
LTLLSRIQNTSLTSADFGLDSRECEYLESFLHSFIPKNLMGHFRCQCAICMIDEGLTNYANSSISLDDHRNASRLRRDGDLNEQLDNRETANIC